MWLIKTTSNVYKAASKNLNKMSENMPNISNISSNIPKISLPNIKSVLPHKKNIEQVSPVKKAINCIFKNKKMIMPVNQMSIIAKMSYNIQQFEQICSLLIDKLKIFHYQSKKAKQSLNSLVLISYLLKHGASGFIDQLRYEITIFQQHSQLSIDKIHTSNPKQIQKIKPILNQIRQRAKYIAVLLTDKKKLLKQKQISMQVRQKIILNDKNSINLNIDHLNQQEQPKNDKVDSLLQHYVWKYWNKFDQKMQNLTDKILQKIDQYLDDQQPQKFQIQQLDNIQQLNNEQVSMSKNQTISEVQLQNQKKFHKQKTSPGYKQEQTASGPVLNTQLL